MSRIGKLPVTLPAGVDVSSAVEGTVTVKGPKGTLVRRFNPDMIISVTDGILLVQRPTDNKEHRALHGLTRTLVSNMVTGVSTGFKRILEIEGVGYRAAKDGNKLLLNLGFSHQVPIEPLERWPSPPQRNHSSEERRAWQICPQPYQVRSPLPG